MGRGSSPGSDTPWWHDTGTQNLCLGCVAAIGAMCAQGQHRACALHRCGCSFIPALGLLELCEGWALTCSPLIPRKGSPGPPWSLTETAWCALSAAPQGRHIHRWGKRGRGEASHPEVMRWQSGDHVCCGMDGGSAVGGSPRTGLALLCGEGSQVQPPQMVDLGLASCPGRGGWRRSESHTHVQGTHTVRSDAHMCAHTYMMHPLWQNTREMVPVDVHLHSLRVAHRDTPPWMALDTLTTPHALDDRETLAVGAHAGVDLVLGAGKLVVPCDVCLKVSRTKGSEPPCDQHPHSQSFL